MNWLTNFIRPKIRTFVPQKEVPDNLWKKCPKCEGMLFHRDLEESQNVCYHCGHHLRISVSGRLELLFDNGEYKRIPLGKVPHDPLKFKDKKKYADRLRDSRQKTGEEDAIWLAKGTMNGLPLIVAAFDFSFMGGSMGTAVGEGIVIGAEKAVKEKCAYLVIPCSGGARMQEGALSLMQMPRTTVAVNKVKRAGLPYIVLLTDPTTGGVSASFAMLGDIHLAEPGCMIGFAGKRVIQETIREELPEDFQTAEYLLEHGMIDMVVERKDMKDTIAHLIDLMMNTDKSALPSGGDDPNKGKSKAKSETSSSNALKTKTAKDIAKEKTPKTSVTETKPANVNETEPAPKMTMKPVHKPVSMQKQKTAANVKSSVNNKKAA